MGKQSYLILFSKQKFVSVYEGKIVLLFQRWRWNEEYSSYCERLLTINAKLTK